MRTTTRQEPLQLTAADDHSGVIHTSDVRELNPVQAALRGVRLFDELSDDELELLSRVAKLTLIPRENYLFRGGDPGHSLLLVLSGVVEVRIERAGARPVPLGTFQSGEFLGEMSFFDGQPRSAAAIALVDCQILSIERHALNKTLMAAIAAAIVAELAKRVRRTDATLTQLSDDVSRAAHVNGHTAVAVELEAIKTLYRRTETVAAETLERADRRATEVMEHADKRAQEVLARADSLSGEVRGHVEKIWALLKRRVAPLAFVLGAVLTWLGIDSVKGVQQKLAEVDRLHDEVKQKTAEVSTLLDESKAVVQQLNGAYQRVRTLEETVGELHAVREAAGLDRALAEPEDLKRAALNYERAKSEVRARYFGVADERPRFERFPPEVVFDAVETYVALVMGGGDDASLRLKASERSELLRALANVLARLADVSDASDPGHAALLHDKGVRDMLAFVARDAEPTQLGELQNTLAGSLLRTRSARARDNLALSLAEIGHHAALVVAQLIEMLESNQARRAAAAAFGLAQLGEPKGFAFISWALAQDGEFAYATALQLAEAGAPKLAELSEQPAGHAVTEPASQRLARWRDGIERALARHFPQNCFEERYTRYLAACLDGNCGKRAVDEAGGQCPTFSASRR